MNWIAEHIEQIASYIGYASVAANFLPTKTKSVATGVLRLLAVAVNAIALDFKSAKAAAQNKNVVVTSKPRSELND